MPVKTVRPCHVISRGIPTLTETSLATRCNTIEPPRRLRGRHFVELAGAPVPSVELRPITSVPCLAETRSAQIPVRADLARCRTQVTPQVVDRRATPEPVAVVDAVDDEPRLEHQRVRNHRVVLDVGVLLDIQVLLDRPAGIGQECPLGADRQPELLQRVVVVSRDRDDLGVGNRDPRLECRQFEVLLVLLRAVVPARQREDQRVAALDLAERADVAFVIGQRVIREDAAGDDVRAHGDACLSVGTCGYRSSCWPPSMSNVAPVSAVFVMTWTASAATSAGPTTRPTGSVARSSARRASSWSPRIDADSGVSTKPGAMTFTRIGASSSARSATIAGRATTTADMRERPTPARRAPVPPMKSSVPGGRILAAPNRATASATSRCSLRSRLALAKSMSRSGE